MLISRLMLACLIIAFVGAVGPETGPTEIVSFFRGIAIWAMIGFGFLLATGLLQRSKDPGEHASDFLAVTIVLCVLSLSSDGGLELVFGLGFLLVLSLFFTALVVAMMKDAGALEAPD